MTEIWIAIIVLCVLGVVGIRLVIWSLLKDYSRTQEKKKFEDEVKKINRLR